MADATVIEQQVPIQSEKLTPNRLEMKPPVDIQPGSAEQNIINRIDQKGNPDQTLQDITAVGNNEERLDLLPHKDSLKVTEENIRHALKKIEIEFDYAYNHAGRDPQKASEIVLAAINENKKLLTAGFTDRRMVTEIVFLLEHISEREALPMEARNACSNLVVENLPVIEQFLTKPLGESSKGNVLQPSPDQEEIMFYLPFILEIGIERGRRDYILPALDFLNRVAQNCYIEPHRLAKLWEQIYEKGDDDQKRAAFDVLPRLITGAKSLEPFEDLAHRLGSKVNNGERRPLASDLEIIKLLLHSEVTNEFELITHGSEYLWEQIYEKGDDDQKRAARDILSKLKNPSVNHSPRVAKFEIGCSFLKYKSEQTGDPKTSKALLIGSTSKWFGQIGLEDNAGKFFLDTAISGPLSLDEDGEESSNSMMKENLDNMITLEVQRPGICKYLYYEYGITQFRRYPPELLIGQFDSKDDLVKPYGLLIYAKSDHNGALSDDQAVLGKLLEQAENLGYALRATECGTKREVVHILNKLRHQYGKISFAFIHAHGRVENFRLGQPLKGDDPDNKYTVSLNDILTGDTIRKGAGAVGSAFIDNPTLILGSCSTGKEGGVAQNLSRIKGTVIGPNADTSLKNIEMRKDEKGNLHFEVEYADSVDTDKTYTQGLKAT